MKIINIVKNLGLFFIENLVGRNKRLHIDSEKKLLVVCFFEFTFFSLLLVTIDASFD